jgi:cephalosporin hydroxylase
MEQVIKDPIAEFISECESNVSAYEEDVNWKNMSLKWLERAFEQKYMYNYHWMGRPIIQLPNDILLMQELIWQIKPDLIVETGIAHGGSLIFSASMLSLLDYYDAIEQGIMLDPKSPRRRVLGLDIDIREHNRAAIEKHPMSNRIDMIQGSSIDSEIIAQVHEAASSYKHVLVCLDSNHTHEHVLAELEAYAPLVTKDSYCVVFDTVIEDMPAGMFPNRPWEPGDNPKTAVWEYLKSHPEFEIDKQIDHKLLISVAPNGYLKRVK